MQLLDRLMTDPNRIMIRYPKMFFVGPPRVGKTITRLRLCQEMINISENRSLPDSTILAECKQVVINIDSENESNKWITSKNENEFGRMLIRYASMQHSTSDPGPTITSKKIKISSKQWTKWSKTLWI